jgi:ABC-type multidrug transport system fused ATPase/permease subunit
VSAPISLECLIGKGLTSLDRTIISYDRIVVLDSGRVLQFDTPLNLFLADDGVFRVRSDLYYR